MGLVAEHALISILSKIRELKCIFLFSVHPGLLDHQTRDISALHRVPTTRFKLDFAASVGHESRSPFPSYPVITPLRSGICCRRRKIPEDHPSLYKSAVPWPRSQILDRSRWTSLHCISTFLLPPADTLTAFPFLHNCPKLSAFSNSVVLLRFSPEFHKPFWHTSNRI